MKNQSRKHEEDISPPASLEAQRTQRKQGGSKPAPEAEAVKPSPE